MSPDVARSGGMASDGMTGLVLRVLALTEVRLRMRRTSTVVALLAVVALSWATIADPAGGHAIMVFNDARVLYTSSALALASAALAAPLFGLGGFYLVRGRMSEDVRSGCGAVIGATPVSGALFLAGRWLGGLAYLGALAVAFMLTVLALHALRGEGALMLGVYVQTYALLLLPMLVFAVSCAVLFDSVAALMGKGGDILYFLVWIAQFVLMAVISKDGVDPSVLVFDFTGLGAAVLALKAHLHTGDFSIGSSPFDPALAPLVLPPLLWSGHLMLVRASSALLALLPLLPAVLLFHRFSPDKVSVSRARRRRSPLAFVNGVLRPVSVLGQPLFALAARLPGMGGQLLGDVALTLVMAPLAMLAVVASMAAALLVPAATLTAVLIAALAFWGILISDLSTRDFAAGAEDLTGALRGGVAGRYLRQFGATLLLGLLFCGVVALRWAVSAPLQALALLAGVAALSALASLFGRCSRTARLFIALFLFGLYVALNARQVAWLDAVGFNGVANAASASMYAAIALAALVGGYVFNRRA